MIFSKIHTQVHGKAFTEKAQVIGQSYACRWPPWQVHRWDHTWQTWWPFLHFRLSSEVEQRLVPLCKSWAPGSMGRGTKLTRATPPPHKVNQSKRWWDYMFLRRCLEFLQDILVKGSMGSWLWVCEVLGPWCCSVPIEFWSCPDWFAFSPARTEMFWQICAVLTSTSSFRWLLLFLWRFVSDFGMGFLRYLHDDFHANDPSAQLHSNWWPPSSRWKFTWLIIVVLMIPEEFVGQVGLNALVEVSATPWLWDLILNYYQRSLTFID